MNKKISLVVLTSFGFILIGCGGGGGGSTASSTPINQPPNPIPKPIIVTQPTNLSTQEKIEASQIAQFFLNSITSETLNYGFIDRLIFAAQNIAQTCPQSVMGYGLGSDDAINYQIYSTCSVAYPRGTNFSLRAGTYSQKITPKPTDTNLVEDVYFNFNDVIMQIEGKQFKINGILNRAKHKNHDVILSSNDLNISSSNNVKYQFNKFASIVSQNSGSTTQQTNGELKVFSTTPYHVQFNNLNPWKTKVNDDYPIQGELKISYVNDASRYLTVKASTNPNTAIYHLEVAKNVLFNHVSRPWSEIIISPAQYQLD